MTRRDRQHPIRWLVLLVAAAMLALGGCQSSPRYGASVSEATTAQHPGADARSALVRVAADQIGTPYRYGGNSRRGFDCSGLVHYAHRQIGVQVPRTTHQQWRGADVPRRRHLVPGDLLFFSLNGGKGRHVGIYEGGGVFIHAPSSGKRVSRASLDNPYWRKRMIGARTFL